MVVPEMTLQFESCSSHSPRVRSDGCDKLTAPVACFCAVNGVVTWRCGPCGGRESNCVHALVVLVGLVCIVDHRLIFTAAGRLIGWLGCSQCIVHRAWFLAHSRPVITCDTHRLGLFVPDAGKHYSTITRG
jgi:hypothetical protein